MRIGFDPKWVLVGEVEMQEHPEPLSLVQSWWVIGPDGEVLGKLLARFSPEELISLFQ